MTEGKKNLIFTLLKWDKMWRIYKMNKVISPVGLAYLDLILNAQETNLRYVKIFFFSHT